ncbi:MAG: galactose oxidase-like domain-containing protein [Planctomycetota bacterium]
MTRARTFSSSIPFAVAAALAVPLATGCKSAEAQRLEAAREAAATLAAFGPYPGQWTMAFDHEVSPSPSATDHLAPFPAAQLDSKDFDAPFNAVHMSLIPRGKDRGKVIVWDRREYLMKPGGAYEQGDEYWSFQCWAIVDPAPEPQGPRFRNFLLPLHSIAQFLPLTPPFYTLFCSGHCWSPHGDLVVAGGATSGNGGTPLTFVYRPDEIGQAWPTLDGKLWTNDFAGPPMYPGGHGRWIYGPALDHDRYYPTVTLTHRLDRTGTELALVSGGTVDLLDFTYEQNPTWNTFEGLRLLDPEAEKQPLEHDTVNGVTTFAGPDDGDGHLLLEEYPRLHLLGDGAVVMSGYEARSARFSPEAPPTTPGAWDITVGQTSTGAGSTPSSFVHRHDGSSVLFARSEQSSDFVGRVGGFDERIATATAEFLLDAKAPPGTPWVQGPSMQHARGWLNTVILPDASILAIGGVRDRNPTTSLLGAREPELWKDGAWSLVSPALTPRGYHATAVLLPDGRVLVGGGEERHSFGAPSFDYEVYEPWYMTRPRPKVAALSQQPALGTNPDGSLRVRYGAALRVEVTLPEFVGMGKIVLMAPGSMTHHSDMHARYVELDRIEVTAKPGGASVLCAMPKEGHAPRGYYMVFALTAGGVPSSAAWLQIVE